jgi:ferredoxin
MKKVFVNENCIGCSACAAICSEVFDMNNEWIAFVKENINIEDFPSIEEAKSACPVEAIQYTE